MVANGYRTVMLTLHRRVLTEIFTEAIEKRPRTEVFAEHEISNLTSAVKERKPDVALVEVPERNGTPVLNALVTCDLIKDARPECKIMLMCPEANKEGVGECIKAKREKRIDDFLFYDATPEFLAAALESMLSVG